MASELNERPGTAANPYPDGRARASLRVLATDHGIVLRSGDGPGGCDRYGAREPVVMKENGLWYLFYDGAGPEGWRACLAVSEDLLTWKKRGPVLDLGAPGEPDSAGACSPWMIREGGWWHMFYLGTPNAGAPPERVPQFPYLTLKARAKSLHGPWEKQRDVVPFSPRPESWMESTASPGFIIREGGEYLQYFSGSIDVRGRKEAFAERTLGLARTQDLDAPWTVQEEPILPLAEQIENSSVWYDQEQKRWYLFTNHVGIERLANGEALEYTDAVWVYWSDDPRVWNPENRAVVLDGETCSWARRCIGMPAVAESGGRLAVLYDGPEGDSVDACYRHIGLAWVELPIGTTRRGG